MGCALSHCIKRKASVYYTNWQQKADVLSFTSKIKLLELLLADSEGESRNLLIGIGCSQNLVVYLLRGPDPVHSWKPPAQSLFHNFE